MTGFFGKQTAAAVRSFQLSRGLAVDGAIGTATWNALLRVQPTRPRWAAQRAKARGRAAMVSSVATPARRPASASLPAKAYETDPGPAP